MSESLTAWQEATRARAEALRLGVPDDDADRSAEEAGRWLLAGLLDWHRRDAKPAWWEFFRLRRLALEDLSTRVPRSPDSSTPGSSAKSRSRTSTATASIRARTPGSTSGTRGRTRRPARAQDPSRPSTRSRAPSTSAAPARAPRPIRWRSSSRGRCRPGRCPRRWPTIADQVVAGGLAGPGPYRAVRELLLGLPPRIGTDAPGGPLRATDEDALQAAVRCVLALGRERPRRPGTAGDGQDLDGSADGGGSHPGRAPGRRHRPVAQGDHQLPGSDGRRAPRRTRDPRPPALRDRRRRHPPRRRRPRGEQWRRRSGTGGGPLRRGRRHRLAVRPARHAGRRRRAVRRRGRPAVARQRRGDGRCRPVHRPSRRPEPAAPGVERRSIPTGPASPPWSTSSADDETIAPDRGLFLDVTYRMHPAGERVHLRHVLRRPTADRSRRRPASVSSTTTGRTTSACASCRSSMPTTASGRRPRPRRSPPRSRTSSAARGRTSTGRPGPSSSRTSSSSRPTTPRSASSSQAIRRRFGDEGRVGTVDKFQGQEGAVAVYSMASSSPDDAPRGIDFLYDGNRFNVAVSRARGLSILVCSPELLRVRCRTPEQMRLANALCAYVERTRGSTGAPVVGSGGAP